MGYDGARTLTHIWNKIKLGNFSHSELVDEDGNDKCQENVSGCGVKNLKEKEREGDVFQV